MKNYREDGTTPYFTFWKDGIKQVSQLTILDTNGS